MATLMIPAKCRVGLSHNNSESAQASITLSSLHVVTHLKASACRTPRPGHGQLRAKLRPPGRLWPGLCRSSAPSRSLMLQPPAVQLMYAWRLSQTACVHA